MPQNDPKPPRGCYYYGCLVAAVLMLFLVVGGLFGLRLAKKMISDFTESAPAPVRTVQVTPAQAAQVRDKVDRFRQEVEQGRAREPLALTAGDLNTLIAGEPGLQELKGKLFVILDKGQLKGEVSVPLEKLGLDIFKGRYLNGTITFDVALRNGHVWLCAREILVKGKPLPGIYQETIRRQNLAKNFAPDQAEAASLGNLESVRVEGDQLLVMPKLR